MRSESSGSRTVGILLLLQMASALIFPFVLIDALKGGYPDFLATAAASGVQIRAGVALAFIGAGLTLALGIWMFSVLRPHSRRTALWLIAICAISCSLDLVHNTTVISMLSVGERFANAGAADAAVYQAWAAAAAGMRRSTHIVQLFAIGAWMASLYVAMWRFRLVPRLLSVFGMVGVAGQFTGVTAMMFLGYPVVTYFAMPLAPIHAAIAVWLIVKGFPQSFDPEKGSPNAVA
jgi:Domain of unknown function (DUF4386)